MGTERIGMFNGLVMLVRGSHKYSFSEETLGLQLNCPRHLKNIRNAAEVQRYKRYVRGQPLQAMEKT